MRFDTEQEGLQSLIGKEMPDPRHLKGRIAPKAIDAPRLNHSNEADLKEDFDVWLDAKRLMFSPEEQIALTGVDHRGRKGMEDQAIRDHHINTFVDWAEEKPRRRAIIVVPVAQKDEANNVAKQVDIMSEGQVFGGISLSPTGEEPATHYWCNWNCSASEYEFFEGQIQLWWQLFDGALYDNAEKTNEFLLTLNLKRIIISAEML